MESVIMVECKSCQSEKVVKSGIARGKQRYKCKACGFFFVIGDERTDEKIAALKALCVLFYSLGKGSYGMLGKLFGRDRSLIYRWIREAGLNLEEPKIDEKLRRWSLMRWVFCGFKKNKLWVIKAVDCGKRRVVAWYLVSVTRATFRRLYNKVKHLKNCIFYTDDWDAFSKVLPKSRHVIGKTHTVTIERDNSNTRHHLGRFTRRTKVVSKSRVMVDLTIRLWCALTQPETFKQWQTQMMYIFK